MGCLQVLVVNHYPGTLSAKKEELDMGKDDETLDMYGWREAGIQYDSLYRSDVLNKVMPAGCTIIITKWFPAAHIDYYFAYRTKQETIGIGSEMNLHQYFWLNQSKKSLRKGDDAYYFIPSNLLSFPVYEALSRKFSSTQTGLVIYLYRGGALCKKIYVFRMKGYRGDQSTR